MRSADEARRVTFASDVDGSVQYYALQPAWPDSTRGEAPALVVSTHGAGVDAISQAHAYAPKSWAHVVAPTNRRRYGFDWEDWGRLDALEALAHAAATLGTDPGRQYVTGHSMGGHIGLRYLYQHSSRFTAAVLTAPMLEIALPLPEVAARWLFEGAVALGFGDHHLGGDYTTQANMAYYGCMGYSESE